MLEKLRHPRFKSTAGRWKAISQLIDPVAPGSLDDIVGLPTKKQLLAYGPGYFEDAASEEVRATVGRLALRTFARSLEVVEGAAASRQDGSSSSSLLLSYDAVYLAASAFILLFGYAPLGRDSEVCVDIFYEAPKSKIVLEDTYAFFVFDRWSHDVVWKLCKRLIGTVDSAPEINEHLKILRSDKLEKVSQRRNSQIYDQASLYSGDDPSQSDYPGKIPLPSGSPWAVVRYQMVFSALAKINHQMIIAADMEKILAKVASAQRRKFLV
jgi:hypothetical protein